MTPDALAVLHGLCFTHPRPWSADEFAALLDTRGVFLRGDGTGFALGRAVAGEVELLTLAVHPDARRAGRGRALLAAFEAEARAQGATEAFLEVAADNAAARALYAGAGYGLAGCRTGYYTAPGGLRVDALVMRKALAGE
ncbi:MAG: GNAT family N-acetyltransferase [Rhodobacteraceae bacterium]|nr:GNAT family N-acetyltransferase [Paracoccaceae bacterium]